MSQIGLCHLKSFTASSACHIDFNNVFEQILDNSFKYEHAYLEIGPSAAVGPGEPGPHEAEVPVQEDGRDEVPGPEVSVDLRGLLEGLQEHLVVGLQLLQPVHLRLHLESPLFLSYLKVLNHYLLCAQQQLKPS